MISFIVNKGSGSKCRVEFNFIEYQGYQGAEKGGKDDYHEEGDANGIGEGQAVTEKKVINEKKGGEYQSVHQGNQELFGKFPESALQSETIAGESLYNNGR